LELIGNVLTEGHSSRLYRKIIYEDQAALSVFASVDGKKDPGLFIITVMNIKQVHTPEKMTSIINESLEKLKTESVTERELEKARNQIETDLIFGLQTNFVRGIRIGFSLTMTGDPLRFIKDLDKYRSTTADDIKRVAKKYFTQENRTVVRLLPKEESQDKSAR
ncbi:hypothetical protein LCGC14_1566020, partial [marine sediment metagenome]